MPELQSNNGTRVETHDTTIETTIHGVNGDDPTHRCSAPECSNTTDDVRHDFSLVLGADMDGMVADWGEVEFCSLDCARKFVDHAPYHDLDARDDGHDTLIFIPIVPVVVTFTFESEHVPQQRATGAGSFEAIGKIQGLVESIEGVDPSTLVESSVTVRRL